MKFGLNILCRIDAPDIRAVPPRGPLIIYSNHTGSIEVPLLYAQLQPRPVTGWAKIESWDNWFLNWIFNLWEIIPIRRGEADMAALKGALHALEKGYLFGVAPEGTRNKTGRLIQGHPGIAVLALLSGAPLLPVANWGGENFMTNLKHLRRTDFHIRVGQPFRLDLGGMKATGEIRQQIVDGMMYRLAALLPEAYRGEYSDLGKADGKYLAPLPKGT